MKIMKIVIPLRDYNLISRVKKTKGKIEDRFGRMMIRVAKKIRKKNLGLEEAMDEDTKTTVKKRKARRKYLRSLKSK